MDISRLITNTYTGYGMDAASSDADEDRVTNVDVAPALNAILGNSAPVQKMPVEVNHQEPGPDNFSTLGNDLKLKIFTEPLFSGDPAPDQPVQGFLDNCPVLAVVTAMTHVPVMRDLLKHQKIVSEDKARFSTFRQRQAYEYLVNDPALAAASLPRLPSDTSNFEDDRIFVVKFFTNPTEAAIGKDLRVDIMHSGHNVIQKISSVFYEFKGNSSQAAAALPLRIYYGHSTTIALYPAAIEKAYLYFLGTSPGFENYQQINDGLDASKVMYQLTGYSRTGSISKAVGDTSNIPNLKGSQWKGWLKKHNTRPTILASKTDGEVGEPDLVVADHAYPVIGYSKKKGTVTVVNILKELGEADRVVTLPTSNLASSFNYIIQGPLSYGLSPASNNTNKGDVD